MLIIYILFSNLLNGTVNISLNYSKVATGCAEQQSGVHEMACSNRDFRSK